jgi:SAM-dependent methyltransferase
MVFSRAFFEHCPNPQKTLMEFKRVTRVGGAVLIITDNAAFWGFYPRFHGVAGVHSGGYTSNCEVDHHYSVFTLEHLETHFETAGLKVEAKGYLRAPEFEGVGTTKVVMSVFNSLLAKSGRFGHMRFPHIYVRGRKQEES